MKRRAALQHILIGATGVMFFPACNFDREIFYKNILIEKDQRILLSDFTNSLLPKDIELFSSPEPTQHFILNNLNQCFAAEDIQKFMNGLRQSQSYLNEKAGKPFSELTPDENTDFFLQLQDEQASKEMKYFFSTTKNLAVKHFTTSEKFMTEQLDYEMVPSRYVGCVEI